MTANGREIAAKANGLALDVQDVMLSLHRRGALAGILRQAYLEEFLVQTAHEKGIRVETVELQHAADLFRRRRGLRTAEATHRWLQAQQLSSTHFEERIERWLLIEKLKDHVALDLESEFAKRNPEFDVVSLRKAIVPTQDAANEMAERLREGMEFSDAARHFVAPALMARAFEVEHRFRSELPSTIGERVFGAKPGATVGPIADPQGFALIHVVSMSEATLDSRTRSVLRNEFFAGWLAKRMKQPIRFPIIEALESPLVTA
ncbi:MAG: peptidylprolyl isomerase [Gemmataceae bacterium]|nr:peptidylprolyl isomerase [Gemmataceae bacterium]